DDTSVIKGEVLDILRTEFTDAEVNGLTKHKSSRGFAHPLTRRAIKDLESGKLPRDPEEMLLFLYEGYICDVEDQMKGFLKSGLLLKSWLALYHGPSAWGGGKSKSKRSAKAYLCDITQVTGRTIAYIATLLHCALSDDETMDRNPSAGKFNYTEFFWSIVTVFEDPDFQDEAEETLQWWNE
ncbi:hypothetical protein M422DRAFT_155071, partial [Sphaerobolus stellatus SS14]